MAYSELIKNFERIRDYMRQFFVYGFKSRNEYDSKSARSYDNERRRIESWLGEHMSFRQDSDGKRVFISVDSRSVKSNPLYKAFKAKSFTSGDISFHFYILDLLNGGKAYTVKEIMDFVSEKYLYHFENVTELDESSVRKKLRKYEKLGLLKSEKRGRELFYSRNDSDIELDLWKEAIAFFSEEEPLGVVGSYLLDKIEDAPRYFSFKHHYILHSPDSGVLYDILSNLDNNRNIELTVKSNRSGIEHKYTVFPMKIFVSTQTGRQYLLCYHHRFRKPTFYRIDTIISVKPCDVEPNSDKYKGYYDKFKENLWGVSTGAEYSIDHIEMTVRVEDNEGYIVTRLEREKRNGTVTRIDENTYLFSADVYDASEMLPWLRTFIGRIQSLTCSNHSVTDRFYADLEEMNRMYGGERNVV